MNIHIFDLVERFLPPQTDGITPGINDNLAPELQNQNAARQLVEDLVQDEAPFNSSLCEASVHRSRRSKVYVACFAGPAGVRIWRTTKLKDYHQALLLAMHWEAQARREQAQATGPGQQAPKTKPRPRPVGFTQKEVAEILGLSERAVRLIEYRALEKLRAHPALRELWLEYRGNLPESSQDPRDTRLSDAEIIALFDLAANPQELHLIEKILAVIQDLARPF